MHVWAVFEPGNRLIAVCATEELARRYLEAKGCREGPPGFWLQYDDEGEPSEPFHIRRYEVLEEV